MCRSQPADGLGASVLPPGPALQSRRYFRITDEETKAQRGEGTCLSHDWWKIQVWNRCLASCKSYIFPSA